MKRNETFGQYAERKRRKHVANEPGAEDSTIISNQHNSPSKGPENLILFPSFLFHQTENLSTQVTEKESKQSLEKSVEQLSRSPLPKLKSEISKHPRNEK